MFNRCLDIVLFCENLNLKTKKCFLKDTYLNKINSSYIYSLKVELLQLLIYYYYFLFFLKNNWRLFNKLKSMSLVHYNIYIVCCYFDLIFFFLKRYQLVNLGELPVEWSTVIIFKSKWILVHLFLGVISDSLWHAIGEHTQRCDYLWGEIWACLCYTVIFLIRCTSYCHALHHLVTY